ncbi:hypothetical protein HKBW3C_02901, partial [Candidatus Hakubella thermalkaliphila]
SFLNPSFRTASKEIIEEHPYCAGCGVALGVRLVLA